VRMVPAAAQQRVGQQDQRRDLWDGKMHEPRPANVPCPYCSLSRSGSQHGCLAALVQGLAGLDINSSCP
jgi:hypothetical protein